MIFPFQAFSLRKNEVCQKEILKFLSTYFVAFFAAAHGFGLVVSDKFLVIMVRLFIIEK